MFSFFKKYRWKNEAKLKLLNSTRKYPVDHISRLKKQSKGRCLFCGVGKIAEFTVDKEMTVVKFNCGHGHKEVTINESINIRETFEALVVPGGRSKRHFVIRYIQGWFKSVSPNLKGGVFKTQLLDKKNDLYKEKVVNALDKNDVVKDQEQRLSEHRGYGSAKFSSASKKDGV